jgi:hypothetical protein|tara:strand:- start:252 stop:863 length:612 start_codon:yes stop_codon:yes gene_type:complete
MSSFTFANEVKVFEFTEEEFETLKVRKVRGADAKTEYTIGKNENGNFLKAVANNSASGLGKEIIINLNKTPYLNVTWKVEKDLNGIDERSKKGHDYAARVFVVKKTGATPLSNRAMNYVFSSNEDVNDFHPSPFTKKSIDYVLATTKDHLNEWTTVKVNVKEHFKRFHDLELDEINGVAIMADTDNSKLSSISYYQNIYFSAE